ncbi:MAG: HAD-IC family P-type ATPase, partial [Sphingomonadaceae bacterium]|nr:HAD-IC family P-type ATPase [Sphingomonadaceae bacterium]
MDAAQARDWHAHHPPEVLDILETSEYGLTSPEAGERLSVHGPNTLPATAARHPLFRFLEQFNNALIYFLLAAATAAFVLGHAVDAVVIIVVVLVNAVVGFIQEGKAEQALSAMQDMIAPHTRVLRDGRRQEVPVGEVVPGDIVHLEAGDRIPADVRLLETHGLLVDEAALTGESVAAEKHHAAVDMTAALGDRRSMAFSGTLVAAGQGVGVVVETGSRTQIGRISRMLQSVERLTTPLLRQIDGFARRCTAVVFTGAVLLFLFAVFVRGFEWTDALIAVVAVAVGVVPEGLPAVITITLAIGVRRMAARNAVIRKLPAVETLGATSVICTDKTGTLTRNEMTVRHVATADHVFTVSGTGYAPDGAFTLEGEGDAAETAARDPIVLCGLLCNDANLRPDWSADGDPMEAALVSLALKAGLDPAGVRGAWKPVAKIPFDAAYRFMATL